jgi:hypothetical protein
MACSLDHSWPGTSHSNKFRSNSFSNTEMYACVASSFESYYILFSVRGGNQNHHHTGGLVIRLLLPRGCLVLSEMFETEFIIYKLLVALYNLIGFIFRTRGNYEAA